MDKNAIKKYAIYARNKLIQSATDKALTIGISKNEIRDPDVQGNNYIIFTSSLGTETTLTGDQIDARNKLINEINNKGFDEVIEEVAYTWFNRLIAIRFMEVNDYLPSRLRVLSSDISGKKESDLMSNPFDADLYFTDEDKKKIISYKENNNLNELFNLLFIKQCNKLNKLLPGLFERTNEFTELLLDIRYDDSEDVVYKLVHDIPEEDFNVSKGGQEEIIGWLYQYYNTELKSNVYSKEYITKDEIPAATQIFTPKWIVRYMVENTLGRLWIEGHPDEELKSNWKYYLDEADQEPKVQQELNKIYEEHSHLQPEDIRVIDPAMGSGHILVYMFDVLMQIYESQGYSQRDAAELILENNLYGLDIDKRAYQLAYFSVMMKARSYNRKILTKGIRPNLYEIVETNKFDEDYLKFFGNHEDIGKKLISNFIDAKEYGSILQPNLTKDDLLIIKGTIEKAIEMSNLGSFDASLFTESFLDVIYPLYEQTLILEQRYNVVVTNPPYLGNKNLDNKLKEICKKNNYTNLYQPFIRRCENFLSTSSYCSLITKNDWLKKKKSELLRRYVFEFHVLSFIDLGAHAFEEVSGEVLQVCTFTFLNLKMNSNGKYYDLEDYLDKRIKFLNTNANILRKDVFNEIPRYSINASVTKEDLMIFQKSVLMKDIAQPRSGITTGNKEKFIRYWFEVDKNKLQKKWFKVNSGGEKCKWYGNELEVINWENDGEQIKASSGFTLANMNFQLSEGLTWTKISSKNLSVRYSNNAFFTASGLMAFPKKDSLFYIMALMNSSISSYYLKFFCGSFDVLSGDVENIPVLYYKTELISKMAQNCVLYSKKIWDEKEISMDFTSFFLKETGKIEDHFVGFDDFYKKLNNKIIQNERYIDNVLNEAYKIENISIYEADKKEQYAIDNKIYICQLISYFVGCVFGRYSLDEEGLVYAGGEFNIERYKSFRVDQDNIIPITDEEYFNDDIVGRFVDFIKTVYGEDTLEKNLEYIAKVLGNKGETSREVIRNYFEKDFIKDHIKMYKKRPIYWLFNSGRQNGFKALIYMHRYDENTVSNVRTEYLHKVQDVYAKTIEDDQYTIDHSSSKSDINKARKHITKLQKQLDETKLYDTALAHIANERISIDLDDGVKVNYAKFQNVEIINDNGKKAKVNLLEKIK